MFEVKLFFSKTLVMIFLPAFILLLLSSCGSGNEGTLQNRPADETANKDSAADSVSSKTSEVNEPADTAANIHKSKLRIEITANKQRDALAYTQGYYFYKGELFESSGLYSKSFIRKINPETGAPLKTASVAPEFFAEGITILNDKLYLLTWRSNKGFIYNPSNLRLESTFTYYGEGWGLTNDDENLIMSDGSNVLRFIEPETYKTVKSLYVAYNGSPLNNINEMEYIDGEIWANIYMTDIVVRINPETGEVIDKIDLSQLREFVKNSPAAEVLNGIAWDKENRNIYLTGKNWPMYFIGKISR